MTSKNERKKREKEKAILRKEPAWKRIERIAAILEKALSPSAEVQHDVRLPVIGMEGQQRQCDVVITYGEPPREFLSIVEVQRRNSKPDINTFNGWVTKMEEVGAQQLICVSAKGYPLSIRRRVDERLGHRKVCLLTLEEITEMPRLKCIDNSWIETKLDFSIHAAGPIKLKDNVPASELQIDTRDRIFSFNECDERFSLLDLTSLALELMEHERGRAVSPVLNQFIAEFQLGSGEGGDFWIHWGEQRYKIDRLPVRAKVEVRFTEVPITIFLYRQDSNDEALAWVISKLGTPTETDLGTHLIIRENKTGSISIAAMQPNYQLTRFYYSNDETAIRSIFKQSLQTTLNSQEIPIISFNNPSSVYDIPIDRLMHIRECIDKALEKMDITEGSQMLP